MSEKKKQYAPPTITEHGKVVAETKGIVSTSWEYYGHRPPPEVD